MSELKAYKMVDEKYCTDCVCVIPSAVYLKSEADKVIAEKDKEIAELKAENESLLQQNRELCQALHVMYSKEEYDKQKYKRCMAMKYVEWLKQIIIGLHPESILYRKAFKRERKWKELADKFKEAK